jgi:hypothetical protein
VGELLMAIRTLRADRLPAAKTRIRHFTGWSGVLVGSIVDGTGTSILVFDGTSIALYRADDFVEVIA